MLGDEKHKYDPHVYIQISGQLSVDGNIHVDHKQRHISRWKERVYHLRDNFVKH